MTRVDNTVRGALSGRAPICLTTDQTVREAAAILSKHEIGAAPVLAGDRLVGMFSERDILRRVVAAERDAGTMRVAEAMTPDPRTVSTATSLVEALALMIQGNFRHLPVVDGDGRVIAMLSMRDIPPVNQLMHFQWTTWTCGEAGTATQGPTSGAASIQFRDTRPRRPAMIKAVTQIRRITNTLTLAALLVVSLSMACRSQAFKADDIKLHGAGSSFVAPLIKRWIDEYKVSHRNFAISYDAVGSGEGVKRFLAEEVDFAGSDEILTDSEIGKTRNSAVMVPVTAGMIVLAYNLPGVESEIKLPRDVLVDIFAGKIRKWDDPRILAANAGVEFPHRDIAIVARQDSSGTTSAFTHHLATISQAWSGMGMGVGKLIVWPKGTMLASSNDGVAGRIRISEGSIGYVEYWFAQRLGLRMAAIQNKSGAFITPTAHAGQLALTGRVARVKELDASVADPADKGAYPITTYSWVLLYSRYMDQTKGKAVRDFVEWGLSQQAQNYGEQLGYIPLSADVTKLGREAISAITQ